MAGFIRRFLTDPGLDVLLEIESVNILDLEPPSTISGIGTGTAMLIAEFEDGDFDDPTEVTSATELRELFGGFGFVYASVPHNNVAARARNADALGSENFNGSGFIALHGKKFKRLMVVRVDVNVGEVSFTRLASLSGNNKQTWDLEPAQILAIKVDGAVATPVTFDAAAAVVTGVAGTFPTLFAGGETLTIGDSTSADFTVTFLAADQLLVDVIARINQFAGFAFASDNTGELEFTSSIRGTAGEVRIVSDTGGAIATLGHVVADTPGTGDVGNIDAATLAEINTVVDTDTTSFAAVDRDPDGNIRILNVTTADGTGRIEIDSATTTALDFGFPLDTEDDADAAANTGGFIPAGTRVTDATTEYVTMETITVPDGATGAGPFDVKVRPGLDDGTAVGAGVATVDTITDSLFAAFAVTNNVAITAALSEAAIDARYSATIESTSDLSSVAREANMVWSARQSNAIRRFLRDNVLLVSAIGMFGRVAQVRPGFGTAKPVAQGIPEPGVGATRDQRIIYCYPQWRGFVPQIATRGVAGGAGFTDDGIIDLGADGFLANVMSQLNPEENPGQLTGFLGAVSGLESGAPSPLTIIDYTNFKNAGICAPRVESGNPIYQSGKTSVDPAVQPSLQNIARRRMADFIQDSLARRMLRFQKQLNTLTRRNTIIGEINGFASGLLSPNNTAAQRIEGYIIDEKSGNTKASLAAGAFRVILRVQTLSSLDSIILQTEIGESVDITELAA